MGVPISLSNCTNTDLMLNGCRPDAFEFDRAELVAVGFVFTHHAACREGALHGPDSATRMSLRRGIPAAARL